MGLLAAILPIVLLVVVMTLPRPRGWLPMPAWAALPAVAALAYGLSRVRAGGPAGVTLHAAVIDGALSALTPMAVVFGAVLLFKTMEASGAMAVVAGRLRRGSPDPVAQAVLVGWSFSFLIEGLSGFGTPAALAAPVLVGLGFDPLRTAAMCLIMNSVPVSFGAVGMPTWFGLGGVGLSPGDLAEVGWRTALVHAAAAPVIVALALRVMVPWAEVRRRAWFVVLAVGASVGPYVLAARFSVEFPSIVGGVSGLIVTAWMVRRRIGLPAVVEGAVEPESASGGAASGSTVASPGVSLGRAVTPLVATILLLAVTRIEALGLKGWLTSEAGSAGVEVPGLGEAWVSPSLVVGLRGILGTAAEWRMPVLYVPFVLPFVVVALVSIPVLGMSGDRARRAWGDTVRRLGRPAVAMAGAMVLVRVMTAGGEGSASMEVGRAMGAAAGPAWPVFAPLLGALGSFFSGSNTVSNLTFAPIQAAIAGTHGLDVVTVLALQSAGGALGNMVCVHNIVAVAAVLGLPERGGPAGAAGAAGGGPGGVSGVLRLTAGPMVVYALIAAAMAGVYWAVC
ncbi:MAG: L-lactate permease [Phycisphaeraceae bacterium]|nr:MAG: L-lactate permease [Phycisphaeraceae bacterium]